MKKLMNILLILMMFTLIGCTAPENKLPDLKEDDKVEMTAQEKADFLSTVIQLTSDETNNFRLDTFLDLEFAMTNESEFSMEGISSESDTTITLDVDYDTTNYIQIGDSVEDTYLFSKMNRFELDMLNDMYSSTTFGDNTVVVDTTQKVNFSLTDTYFLSRSDYAYFHLNGSASVESKEGDTIVESETHSKTFNSLKEKVLEGRLTQEMYVELMQSLVEFQDNLMIDASLDMTEEEKADALQTLDEYVNIFSSGTTHTVQVLITSQKVSQLIDTLFESIEADLSQYADIESFGVIKNSIKTAFKSFNFDFRIILEGELDGVKKLSKIELLVTGNFSGFTLDMAEFEETPMPMLLKLTVKLNKLGFVLDFDADPLTLPTEAELETFTLVEQPSFADIFEGAM